MKIYLASDHAGFEYKEILKAYLPGVNPLYIVEDVGPFSFNAEDDYPDFMHPLAKKVSQDEGSFGAILGGSGQGEAMCANRTKGVRAMEFYGPRAPIGSIDIAGAQSSDPFEVVKLARVHNNANVISIGVRFMTSDEMKFAVELFLATPFEGGERHIRRVLKIDENPDAK